MKDDKKKANCSKCSNLVPDYNLTRMSEIHWFCPRCYAEYRVQTAMEAGIKFTDKDLLAISEGRKHVDWVLQSKGVKYEKPYESRD